jgi:hypothetical protein
MNQASQPSAERVPGLPPGEPSQPDTSYQTAVEFSRDLAAVVNRYSRENASNTPDFVLAEFMVGCLRAWNETCHRREEWYGVHHRPCGSERSPTMKLIDIARVCYQANKAYCEAMGDRSQPSWEAAPQWQVDSAYNGVLFHRDNPNAGPEASHENWVKDKMAAGWVYGPCKDPEAKAHPCIVPFNDLPAEQKAKDYIFRAIVHALLRKD